MIKDAVITICILSFLLLLSQNAQACSCSGGGVSAKFSFSSDVVFVGKVLGIKKAQQAIGFLTKEPDRKLPESARHGKFLIWQMQIVELEVTEPLKGVTEKTIHLATAVYN